MGILYVPSFCFKHFKLLNGQGSTESSSRRAERTLAHYIQTIHIHKKIETINIVFVHIKKDKMHVNIGIYFSQVNSNSLIAGMGWLVKTYHRCLWLFNDHD